ncbi:MAG TPA: BTAD domain-containing putative transcriptional regulator [Umezawaea sp.]|nr:BTAD domain-containing putative transcriptional regulator [Umezawaea sp.]
MTWGDDREGEDPDIALGVLGGLEVRDGREAVPVGHARQRSVLAVLAVEVGRVVPTDTLINRVWGERPPSRARSTLRTYLTRLRRALAPKGVTITHRNDGYLLGVGPDTVDLHRFRRLLTAAREYSDPYRALVLVEDALALWRGEPLAELDTPWAQAIRERLRRERAAAAADRLDWGLACRRHHELLPELTASAADDPLDERGAAQLLLALYRSGRQADALTHYQHVRQHLAEELGIDPGPALRDLHQRILTADPALDHADLDGGVQAEAATDPVLPRQLPAVPGLFTGRTDELAALSQTLDGQDTVMISVIAGAGGIGKTWLALAWAHRNLNRFPDGQLFVDLRGFSPDGPPLDPAVAMRGFLDALGVEPARIPGDLHTQTALYRSLVADKQILILLDNAATAEQVVPLLPGGASCTVLVTSRQRLPVLLARHSARPLPLGVLTDTESRALLAAALGTDRVTADQQATNDLIALCGGYSLALGLVAARAHPHVPLTDIVAELRELGLDALSDTDDPSGSLPAVLSWSLRRLTDVQHRVFALVSIAPGPDIGLPAAISLTGLPERQTRAVLRALVDASLIDFRAGGRYAMHDLVRAYATAAADDLTEQERHTAFRRVVDFYVHTAHAAECLLNPYRQRIRLDLPTPGTLPHALPDASAALAWMDAEGPYLLAAQHTAAAQERHQVVWQLAWASTNFYHRRAYRQEVLIVWHAVLNAADHLSDPAIRTTAHRRLSRTYAELGQHQQAAEHLNQALALSEKHHDPLEQANTQVDLAWAWQCRGNDRQALTHALRALTLFRALDQPWSEAMALDEVGRNSARLGHFDTARDHCQAALAVHRHLNDLLGEANSLGNLAWIDHHTGRHHQAIDRYHQALDLRRTLEQPYEAANVLYGLGYPHLALGQDHDTRTAWQEALQIYREQGRDDDAARVQRQLDDLDTQ